MSHYENEQQLIDIIYQVAQRSVEFSDNYKTEGKYTHHDKERHMQWVSDQLNQCGFKVVAIGSSWGALVEIE